VTVAKPGQLGVTRWTPVRTGSRNGALIGAATKVFPVASCVAVMVTPGSTAVASVMVPVSVASCARAGPVTAEIEARISR